MKKYDNYKNSGIEWIGEVPEHWNISRLANFGEFLKGRGVSKSDLTDEGIPVVLYGDIYTKYDLKAYNFKRKTSVETAKNSIEIHRGDLLFTASGETKEDIGKCITFLGNEKSVAGGDVVIFRQNSNDSLFLSFVFNSHGVVAQKNILSKGEIVVHIYASQLRNISFVLPPTKEQISIANYLDHKTTQIDTLISKKEKFISLLQEERTSVINQAVTQGLDPKVKMKDSGIEWLGKIPEHWDVKRLKYIISKKIDNRGKTPPFGDEGRPMLEVKQIDNESIYPNQSFDKYVKPDDLIGYIRDELQQGDVLIATVGATAGKCCIVPKDFNFFIAQNVIGFRCNEYTDNLFFYYMIESSYFKDSLLAINKSNIIDNLKVSVFINNICIVPSLDEQKEISKFITTKLNYIKNTILKSEKEIEILKEYKTALISEVVTGKVDVRDVVLN